MSAGKREHQLRVHGTRQSAITLGTGRRRAVSAVFKSVRLAMLATVLSAMFPALRRSMSIAFAALFAGLSVALTLGSPPATAQTAPSKAAATPVSVAIHVSSDGNRCYAPGLVAAIKHFTSKHADTINADGGINGRPLKLKVYDDFEDAKTTTTNVSSALTDDAMVAMIGVSSSTRGRGVFEALGSKIKTSAIPFITEMSLDRIFADVPNVFTMASSVRNELEVIQEMIAKGGYERPVFVGLDNDDYSFALEDGVADNPQGTNLAERLRVPVRNYQLDEATSEQTARQIKAADADLIVVAIHSGPTAQLLSDLRDMDVDAPILVLLGRISTIIKRVKGDAYPGPISQIAREGVPNVFSERLRDRIWSSPKERWVFEDTKNESAAGWEDGSCNPNADIARQLYDPGNRRAVGRGTQYRDMLDLIVRIARDAPADLDVPGLRRYISENLRSFSEGRQVLKGLWRDWAFTDNRTAAGDTLLLTKSPGDEAIVLSPIQYQRINGTLQRSSTLYTSIDLTRLSHIDTNDQSFDAEFYLTMKSTDNRLSINDIDFTNAYRSPIGDGKLLSHREIHSGDGRSNFPEGVRLYKVSGRFMFEPELSRYPFDTQRFSVSFQPLSTAQSFLIQPPATRLRSTDMNVDGWRLVDNYVGADQDIIPTIGASLSERRIVPFYKFNATWVAERIAIDYYTRVIIPLGFILLVTYFSVFLPHPRFDSTMGIQVTALLSAIALYLALPKIDTEQATLSDKIFMLTYAAVSMMIGLSILKDNLTTNISGGLGVRLVAGIQRIVFPMFVIGAMALTLLSDGFDPQQMLRMFASITG
ncbi:MAG: ABC transporter substrate-binding protein [Pseudomonadota bacterium]